MSRFTGPLSIAFDDTGRKATLLEPLVWDVDEKGSGLSVTVPTGFTSDGATVPRILWWLMPAWGDKGTRAAILHDFILDRMKDLYPLPGLETRERADWQFYLALKALGVGEFRARILWGGVRAYSIYYERIGVYLKRLFA